MSDKKVTAVTLLEMKRRGEKISMLTAYDYCTALLMDQSEIDVLLVGDSLGMVVMGEDTTLPVTMDEMIHHTRAAARGVKRALLVGDMPYMSYQISPEQAAENAGRFVKEGNAEAIKLEGGRRGYQARGRHRFHPPHQGDTPLRRARYGSSRTDTSVGPSAWRVQGSRTNGGGCRATRGRS